MRFGLSSLRPWTMLALVLVCPHAHADGNEAKQLRTGSRAPYFHRLTLYDHDGEAISPEDPEPKPYSPRATCGKCHAYETIACGWHFSAGKPDEPAGRPGEPWLFIDEASETVLPLSLRGWPGTFSPESVMSRFEFAERFARHLPGGGWIEPSQRTMDATDESARWNISGALEIDCMVCHSASTTHDQTQAERNLEPQNFKWIPTVAMGLGRLRGKAKDVPDNFDPFDPNAASSGRAPPVVEYRTDKFDADERVHFDITRRPSAERCYFCHSEQPVGDEAPPRWQHHDDVHLRAGLTCVDCHRNDIDHRIRRGYWGEPETYMGTASLTCRGCHLGEDGGHYGAPKPEHAGLPPLHLAEMSCTSCHAGLKPSTYPYRLQTSMSHALGIPSKERGDDDPPPIVGPIFARNEHGVIFPYRAVEASYWGVTIDDERRPLTTEELRHVIEAARAVRAESAADGDEAAEIEPFFREQIETVIAAAQPKIAAGELFFLRGTSRFTKDGSQPTTSRHDGYTDHRYRWAIGHDVRPARDSLGSGGCTDCHAEDAAMFHGRVARDESAKEMYVSFDSDPGLVRMWEAAVGSRVTFKWFAWPVAGLIALVLLASVVEAIRRRLFRERNDDHGLEPTGDPR